MKKILYIAFLLFFVHLFFLEFFFSKLDSYTPKYNGDGDHGMHFLITCFFTFVIFIMIVFLAIIEHKMEFDYKNIMFFLVYANCLLVFYLTAFSEYPFFTNHNRFNIFSKIIILIYFVVELFFSYYIVNRLYRSDD